MQNKELCVSIIESNCFLRNGLKSILSKKEYNVLADYSLPEYYLKNYQEHNLNNINDIIGIAIIHINYRFRYLLLTKCFFDSFEPTRLNQPVEPTH